MRAEVQRKWRPSLGLIIVAVLLAVLALPVGIIAWFRVMDSGVTPLAPAEVVALAAAVLLTLVVAFVLTRTITAPIYALLRRAAEIGKGGRSAIQPLGAYGTQEIADLSQGFLDLASQLVDRTDTVRSFAAHVSHELKSPLTGILGSAELLRDELDGEPMSPGERRRFLDNIVADADRMAALLGRLRELAQAEVPAPRGTTTLLAVSSQLASRGASPKILLEGDVDRRFGLPTEVAVTALGHLLENAEQHGSREVRINGRSDSGGFAISVVDDGDGIPEGNRALVFQPFFSTRRDRGGTGMGLSIVQTMLAVHGGSIELADVGSGAGFLIRVPLG